MRAIVFDDGKAPLDVLRDLRPIFDCRFGAVRTVERVRHALRCEIVGLHTPERMAAHAAEKHQCPVNAELDGDEGVLLINGRVAVPPLAALELRMGEALVEEGSGDLVAAHVSTRAAEEMRTSGYDAAGLSASTVAQGTLITRPWDFARVLGDCLAMDLGLFMRRRRVEPPRWCGLIGSQRDVSIDPRARVRPGVVIDAEGGPVVVSADAEVRPGAVLVGPCAIGPGSIVRENAVIKAKTVIGPVCRVAGEVGGTVMQGYANKAHEGHLGDSWLGEWVNLGAGTTNSNMLNTYATHAAAAGPGAAREDTGLTFLGCVLGDHVKTAICTRVMAGAVVGTGTMWASQAFLAGAVERLSWVTDREGVPLRRDYAMRKFLGVMRASMARRSIEPSAAYETLVTGLVADDGATV